MTSEPSSKGDLPVPNRQIPARETTIRGQLLWASASLLIIFFLISALMVTAVFRQLIMSSALQHDTSLVQIGAGELSKAIQGGAASPNLLSVLRPFLSGNASNFYLIDPHGEPIEATGNRVADLSSERTQLKSFNLPGKAESRVVQIPPDGNEVIIAYAPLTGSAGGLVMVEPWNNIMAPAFYYQAILIVLLAMGATFSLFTLSLGIGRVTHPISELVEYAHRAVPGSIFHPMPEQGPAELRTLINAFNQMVVQLAEQQTSLRQYAHQALLSQEQERQRLSHELHDGTLQDLVGLAQRVELCRTELDKDPLLARRRLDELKELLLETLGDVRRISNALRPSILEDLGLPAALQALSNDLKQQMPSIQCHFSMTGQERRLAPDLELAVFRVVQEALNNIRNHAHLATQVGVELVFKETEVEALVRNDGPVFPSPDIQRLVRGGHLGLAGMYERARLFHGELTLSSDPTTGTTIRLQVPCPSESVGLDQEMIVV